MPLTRSFRAAASKPRTIIIAGQLIAGASGAVDAALSVQDQCAISLDSTGRYDILLDGGVVPGVLIAAMSNITDISGTPIDRIVSYEVLSTATATVIEVLLATDAGVAVEPVAGEGFSFILYYQNSSV